MTQGEALDMATSLLVHVHKRHLLGSALIPAYLAGTGCVCAFTIMPVPTSEAVPKHTLAFTGQYGTGAGRQGSCLVVHSARDRSSPLCLIWISQRRGRRYSRRLWCRSTAHARWDRGHFTFLALSTVLWPVLPSRRATRVSLFSRLLEASPVQIWQSESSDMACRSVGRSVTSTIW
jgi:hypothetical protein